jgi:hypothetical protein
MSEATVLTVDPNQPHVYIPLGVPTWRTCALCGRGANARVHRNVAVEDVTVDGVTFRRVACRASAVERGDRLVRPSLRFSGPPVTAVESTVAGTVAVETVNGGRRLYNPWDTVTVLRPDPSSLHESRVWSPLGIDLP